MQSSGVCGGEVVGFCNFRVDGGMDALYCRPMATPPFVEPSTDPRRNFGKLKEVYGIYREYIRVEHNLQHERSTWHQVIQGFLFTMLGVIGAGQLGGNLPDRLQTERDYLPYVLAIVGITIAILTSVSIEAANAAINSLCKKWKQVEAGYDDDVSWLLPSISGGGDPNAVARGKLGSRFIPWIIVLVWLGVIVMFTNDKIQQARHSDSVGSNASSGTMGECGPLVSIDKDPSRQKKDPSKEELMREIGCATGFSAGVERQLQDEYGVTFRLVPDYGIGRSPPPDEKH